MSSVYDIRIEQNSGTNFYEGNIIFTTSDGEANVNLSSSNVLEGTNNLYYTEQRVTNNITVQEGSQAFQWGNHTTAGFASSAWVINNFVDNDTFNSATTGLNQNLDNLQNQINSSPDYTTAGLATVTYVDGQDTLLQNQIDGLVDATTGINENLNDLQNALDSLVLQDLTDVDDSNKALNYVLTWAGTAWKAQSVDAISGTNAITLLNDLGDVTITTPLDKQFLRYNGIEWVNETVEINDYTTAGLATIVYVDSQDALLQGQIDGLINATTGINTSLDDLQSQIDGIDTTSGNVQVLDDLDDVTITGPTDNQFLRYEGGQWINETVEINDYTTAGLATVDYVNNNFVDNDTFNSATQGIIEQIEILSSIDTLKAPDAYFPDGTYPTTHFGDQIESGDTWRMTAEGTLGSVLVNTEDLLIALTDLPLQNGSNFMVVESNRDQATEQFLGVAKIATNGETLAGTNDTNIITPLKLQNKLDSLPNTPDYTTAGLASVTYVDAQDTLLQNQIDGLVNATTGINTSLDDLQNQIDNLPSGISTLDGLDDVAITTPTDNEFLRYNGTIWVNELVEINDYTTAGLATTTYVDGQDTLLQNQIDGLINATTGINTELISIDGRLDDLENNQVGDYTTAGLASVTYVDAQDTLLQNQIDGLVDATTGINTELNDLQTQIDNLPAGVSELDNLSDVAISAPSDNEFLRYNGTIWVNELVEINDYTTAGLATVTYVDGQDVILQAQIDGLVDATTGINTSLDDLDNRIDNLELNNPDYTTAGLASSAWVIDNFVDNDTFNSSTTGINNALNDLDIKIDSLVLQDLTDVDDSNKMPNYVLSWAGTAWKAQSVEAISGTNAITFLNDLGDVTITTPTNDQFLRYNGIEWVNETVDIKDYTTAGLASIVYVDSQDALLQAQIDGLINATTGINTSLDDLDNRIDNLELNNPDYTTAGLASSAWVIDNFVDNDTFNSATTGINTVLNDLQSQIDNGVEELNDLSDVTIAGPSDNQFLRYEGGQWVNETVAVNDYTTAGLATTTYVDGQDALLQNQIDGLVDATTGINTSLDDLQSQIDSLPSGISALDELSDVAITTPSDNEFLRYNGTIWVNELVEINDYTTAGLATVTYVDNQDALLQNQIDELENATTGINIALNDLDNRIDDLELNNPDYTTAGLASSAWVIANFVDNDTFNSSTTGINIALNDLQSQIDNGVEELNDLSDVTITTPSDNQFLRYEGGEWINETVAVNDYTTAGLASVTYVDAQDALLQNQIDGLINATTGINTSLDDLDNRIDNLELNNPDYTTAGLASSSWVIANFVDNNTFNSATTGINTNLNDLQSQINNLPTELNDLSDVTIITPSDNQFLRYEGGEWINETVEVNDYTTAGLATVTYVDNQDAILQAQIDGLINATTGINIALDDLDNRIDNLELNNPDYTTAGLASSAWVIANFVDNDTFNSSTTGINTELNNLQSQIDSLPTELNDLSDVTITAPSDNQFLRYEGGEWINETVEVNDYTTAGLASVTYVDAQDAILQGQIDGLINATTGINIALDDLDSRIDNLELNNPDYTTAGLASSAWVINNFVDIDSFTSATTGINTELNDLQSQIDALPNVSELNDLTDVTIAGPSDNQFLRYEGGQWINETVEVNDYTTAGLASVTYVDAQDVLLQNQIDGLVNATTGINTELNDLQSQIDALPNVSELNDLTDVTITTPSNNQFLRYEGGEWVNETVEVNDYTTAGLASIVYVDAQDTLLQNQIDGLINATTGINIALNDLDNRIDDLELNNPDYTTAGLASSAWVINNFVDNDTFNSSTTGINTELNDLQSQIDALPNVSELNDLTDVTISSPSDNQFLRYEGGEWINETVEVNDYTTAGLASIVYVDAQDAILQSQIDGLVDATTGINTELNDLQSQIDGLANVEELNDLSDVTITAPSDNQFLRYEGGQWVNETVAVNDYTTAGLASVTYVDAQDTLLQNQIDGLVDATTGINTELNDLQSQIDNLPTELNDLTDVTISSPSDNQFLRYEGGEWINETVAVNDYTTAGLASVTYVDTQDAVLQGQIDVLESWGDQSTQGFIKNIVEDITPELGGDLNTLGNNIFTSSGDVLINNIAYPLNDGTDGQVMTTDGQGNLTFQDTRDPFHMQFGLTEEVINTDVFFYAWRTRGNNTSNTQRSNRANGLNQACSPIMIPYDVNVKNATLVLKTSGVNNGSVTFPVTYMAKLYVVGFDNAQDPAINSGNPYDVHFTIPTGNTVGTFGGADTEAVFEVDLDIDLSRGQMIGLEFEAGTGASEIAISQMAFISLYCEKRS